MLMFEPGFAPIMPKHIYAGTDYMTNPANQKPVGTGPFMFKEWKRGEYIKLARNPDYWKPGKPYLDELVFNVIPDAASRAVASSAAAWTCCAAATWTTSTSSACAPCPRWNTPPPAGRCSRPRPT